jgi:hypothetical protein
MSRFLITAGLVPAIHWAKDVDARDKPGHDGELSQKLRFRRPSEPDSQATLAGFSLSICANCASG